MKTPRILTPLVRADLFPIFVLALSCTAPLAAADWPQWMGPHGDATAEDGGLLLGDVELRELWRHDVGRAYSSVSVVGSRAFTLEYDGEAYDLALALDAETGRTLWRRAIGSGDRRLLPASTPAIAGGRVFAMTAFATLVALDAEDGKTLWRNDLRESLGASPPSYGMSTSPLVGGERLYVLAGGAHDHNLVALDVSSGEVLWSTFHAPSGTYASPVMATIGGERQLVVPAGDRLYGVLPEDGTLRWSTEGVVPSYPNPLVLPGDRIFLGLEQSGGALLRLSRKSDGWQAAELWRKSDLHETYSPAVYLDGVVYTFSGSHLVALDPDSGRQLWSLSEEGQEWVAGSLIAVDGRLVVLRGTRLDVFAATREGGRRLASLPVFGPDGGWYAPPSYASGRIYVRNGSEVVTVEVVSSKPHRLLTSGRLPHVLPADQPRCGTPRPFRACPRTRRGG